MLALICGRKPLKMFSSWHAANFEWPFRILSFVNFLSNLDIRDLKTYPRTFLVIFEIYYFLMILVSFEYFSECGCSQNIKVFLDEGVTITPLSV